MSYSRPRRALGDTPPLVDIRLPMGVVPPAYLPSPLAPELPTWQLVSGTKFSWGSPGAALPVEMATISDEAVLNRMAVRLVQLWALAPTEIDVGPPGHGGRNKMTAKRTIIDWAGYEQFHIRDNGPFVQAFYAYWCRVDHDVATWPSGFEMSMTTGGGTAIHVSQPMYERLRLGQMWTTNAQESQTLFGGDWLFKGLLAQRMREMGYLSSSGDGVNVSAAEGGAMWSALHNYVAEMLTLPKSLLLSYWPRVNLSQGVPWAFTWGQRRENSGIFVRDNDQIVIQLSVIKTILNGVSARAATRNAVAQEAARTALRSATIRPPIIGLPSTAPRPVFNMAALVNRPMVYIPMMLTPLKGLVS